jgi:major histocompatibility complex class I
MKKVKHREVDVLKVISLVGNRTNIERNFSGTFFFKTVCVPGVVAHAFNPSTWEAEAGGLLSSRPAWSTE